MLIFSYFSYPSSIPFRLVFHSQSCILIYYCRGVVINGSLAHPFAITVYRDRLYWTDWKNKSIFSCNKSDCNVITKVQGNLYAPMDIE